ncbi:unnamed protein product [Clonostachys rosea]|uniref:Glutathione S-transferase n=1 Tax=Bionectria ochroleuca TaxID=29856 RepID=A0ABY6UAJ0_BIOOC|nr:unnamed protein product [Clonostachys rosea]
MSDFQPITVYAHPSGPNPFKVIILLEELGISYEKIVVENPKEEWFIAINPNGRLPAIIDPNTDLTIWESGAIIEYLIEEYDKSGKLSVEDNAGKWQLKQWLHFQTSGQGPYFGQATWFHRYHPEDVPSAKERYLKEIVRVIGVLDRSLKGKEFLVGGKVTYADLAFVSWNVSIFHPMYFHKLIWEGEEVEKNYPDFAAWYNRMFARQSVQTAYAEFLK